MHGRQVFQPYPDASAGRPMPLYVHIPFCESLCPFCPFHRVLLDVPLADVYFEALSSQLEVLAGMGYVFDSLCIGGGTPTTRPDALTRLVRKAGALWDLAEVTVETNPNHLRAEVLQPLRAAGVTRLSVGIQSLHDHHLMRLGRLDAYGGRDRILESIASVQGWFDTFNVDMIFNLPGQGMDELNQELDWLKASGVDQISYHPLMPTDEELRGRAEFGTVDFKRERGMYRRIIESLAPEYRMASVWCFNRRAGLGDEYFVYSPSYLGIGSGAFSLIDGCFHATTFDIHQYIHDCHAGRPLFAVSQPLGRAARYAYRVLTRWFGIRVPATAVGDQQLAVNLMRGLGLVRIAAHGDHPAGDHPAGDYELTEVGCYVWLVLMRRFFMEVNRYRQQMRHGRPAPCPFTAGRVLWRLLSR